MIISKRTIHSILIFLLSMFLFWYSGADFLQRNMANAMAIVASIAWVIVYNYILWLSKGK